MNDIFGYSFEEIQSMQQKQYKPKTVDMAEPTFDPVQEKADVAMLNGMGEAKLREIGYFGVLDRLQRNGYLKEETK